MLTLIKTQYSLEHKHHIYIKFIDYEEVVIYNPFNSKYF